MTALLYDDATHHDSFTVTAVAGGAIALRRNGQAAPYGGYRAAATRIVEAVRVAFYLKADARNGVFQLMAGDGAGADVPVVDHVVGLSFEYFGDPRPPRAPLPPAVAVDPYPAGENCVIVDDGSTARAPRLGELAAAGSGLVALTPSQLADGPWCPDAASDQRWDADLLRVRTIAVTIRVQAASAALRGPAGVLFAHGGSSRDGTKWLPDHQVRIDVSPRNLNLDR